MKKMKKALIIGIAGQDGSYLAELLLSKGYEVHGLVRRVALEDATHKLWRINHILPDLKLHAGTIESYASVFSIVERVVPDECYHLAAQSFVSYSFDDEISTVSSNITGTMHVLSAIKQRAPSCRFYNAGSSEMFGLVKESPQNEQTHFYPRSPYGVSKIAGFHYTRNYRDAYKMYACSGILFNHESPRRGFEFVTRKISNGIASLILGQKPELTLGNLASSRDWGYAKDYVEAMWLMLQQETPQDYVIGTGVTHSVKEFTELCFLTFDVKLEWKESNENEHALVSEIGPKSGEFLKVGSKVVSVDPIYYRPSEADLLCADASSAKENLNWEPTVQFEELVKLMIEEDFRKCRSNIDHS
ncbi:MAG: GDPmannose 4,6-dehydratase [Candidatus Azotimanducaceae bacterium]|jgi:GDPmannose 4,6-dehydratase